MRRFHLKDAATMTDRERILTAVSLYAAGPFCGWYDETKTIMQGTWDRKVRPGDLVKCVSQRSVNHWNIAWYDGRSFHRGESCHLLRELGGEWQCHMANESLYAIRGIPSHWLLEGHQWKAYLHCQRALAELYRQDGHYDAPRFQSVWFTDRHSRDLELRVRCHLFRVPRGSKVIGTAVPLRYTSRLRVRDTVSAIRGAVADGYTFAPMEDGEPYWAVDPEPTVTP